LDEERVLIRTLNEVGIELVQIQVRNVVLELESLVDSSEWGRVKEAILVEDLDLVLRDLDRNYLSVILFVIDIEVISHFTLSVKEMSLEIFCVVRYVLT
jgi:hypothetical protein